MRRAVHVLAVSALLATWVSLPPGRPAAQDGRITTRSGIPFTRVAEALERAIAEQQMALVCHANAQRGAAARGVTIKGNQVMMVFRNDFAVRPLAADPEAGFEAPIRIYLYRTRTAPRPSPTSRRPSSSLATRTRRSRLWPGNSIPCSRRSSSVAWPVDDYPA